MTKLMEWVTAGIIFLAIWLPIVLGITPINMSASMKFHILWLPIYLVILFGMFSAFIVLYRVATFNDCPEAYKELKEQITEARQELKKKGIKLETHS